MNSLERGIKKGFIRTKGGSSGAAELHLDSVDGWNLPENAMSTSTAMKLGAVSGCMEIISNSIAMLPTFLMDSVTKEHYDDHPLNEVLCVRPNELQTPMRYRQLVQAHILAYGESFVWIYRNRAGQPVELLPIPHGWCEPWFNAETGHWFYRAEDPKTGRPYLLNPADVIHKMGFTLDGIHGMSVLQRARQSIETAQRMETYQNATYKNGGRPSGVLKIATDVGGVTDVVDAAGKTVKRNRKDVIREEWAKFSTGENSFRTAILDNGMEYAPVALSNSDAQFVENKELCVADICRFFCLPGYKVGIGKQSYNSNEQNNIEFVTSTLQPYIVNGEQEDTFKLLTISERQKRNLQVRVNMAAVLRSDAKTRAEVENIYRMNGTFSVNDICDLEDRPHVPGGEVRYGSLNYIPLELFELLSTVRNMRTADKADGKEEN